MEGPMGVALVRGEEREVSAQCGGSTRARALRSSSHVRRGTRQAAGFDVNS